MKLRRIQAIAIGILFLLLCMTGCGRQSEDAVQQSDTEQYLSTELSEESSAESPVVSSAEDLLDTNGGEPEVESASKPYSEMTTAEKIKTLTVEGCPLPIPCKVEELGDGLYLGSGVTFANGTKCILMYNGNELGNVTMPEVSITTDYLVDMSEGYEDEWINAFMMYMSDGDFEISGITSASSREEIINLWGEPDDKNEVIIDYYDYNEDTGEIAAHISFGFLPDGKMLNIHVRNNYGINE